jgi:outer membrane protein with beta-barrel domain
MGRVMFIESALALVLIGASTSALAADASSPSSPRVTIGGFWSANLATVSSTPAPIAIESRQWNGGGATFDIPLGGPWSIDARAMWNRKGATLTLASNTVFQDVYADYLSMPVLFKVSGGGSVRAYGVAGPELGIRLRSRVVTKVGSARTDEDARDVTERTDIAATAGGGIERELGRSRVFVEGLYSFGLRNVLKSDNPSESMRTRTFTMLAGLRF